jgi:thioredoxin 1
MREIPMPPTVKKLIVTAVIVVVAAVLLTKSRRDADNAVRGVSPTSAGAALPKIVCIGAGKCIPCKAMEPVREELRREYAGRMTVEFHDLTKDLSISKQYGVRVIPTTIFYDASGKELARNEGFMSKQDILAQFERLGVAL